MGFVYINTRAALHTLRKALRPPWLATLRARRIGKGV